MLIQVARYSLAMPMNRGWIEHEIVNASVVTSSKLSEFSCADCDYVVAPYFFSSSESVKLFIMAHQITPSVSSFSECLELFFDFHNISVDPSDVILLLATSDVCLPGKPIYLFILLSRVLPSEFVSLHFLKMHDETHK